MLADMFTQNHLLQNDELYRALLPFKKILVNFLGKRHR